jgi:alpha-1,2-mannosyltransferase
MSRISMRDSKDGSQKIEAGWPPVAVLASVCLTIVLALLYIISAKHWFAGVHGLHEAGPNVIGHDFVNIWTAAKLTLQGHIAWVYDFRAFHQAQERLLGQEFEFHNWSYPPVLIPWIAVFGLLPYLFALGLWLALTFALYAFAVASRRPHSWSLVFFLALAPASIENVSEGQNGFLLAALFVGGLRLLETRPALAGLLLGGLIFKPHLGLLLPFALLSGRHMKVLLFLALTATFLAALSVLAFGFEPWRVYFQTTLPFQVRLLEQPPIYKYLYMMPTPFVAFRLAGASLGVAALGSAFFALCAVVFVTFLFRRKTPLDLRMAGLLAATFFVAPYSFSYDLTLLSAAVISFVACRTGRAFSTFDAILSALAWFLPLFVFESNAAHIPVSPLILAFFMGALTLRFISTTGCSKTVAGGDVVENARHVTIIDA